MIPNKLKNHAGTEDFKKRIKDWQTTLCSSKLYL